MKKKLNKKSECKTIKATEMMFGREEEEKCKKEKRPQGEELVSDAVLASRKERAVRL